MPVPIAQIISRWAYSDSPNLSNPKGLKIAKAMHISPTLTIRTLRFLFCSLFIGATKLPIMRQISKKTLAVRHKNVQNIPKRCTEWTYSILLYPKMFNK
jgi:hypothetical protein